MQSSLALLSVLALTMGCTSSKIDDSDTAAGSTSGSAGDDGGDGGSGSSGSGAGGDSGGGEGSSDGGGSGGANEDCTDGIDNNADGLGDCSDAECIDTSACACISEDLGTETGSTVTGGENTDSTNDFEGTGGTPGGRDEAFSWSAPATGCWAFDTVGSTYDTVLRTFGTCGGEQLSYNDDHVDGTGDRVRQSRLVVGASAVGDAHIIVVDSFAPDETEDYQGSFVLNIEESEPVGGEAPPDLGTATGADVATGATTGDDSAYTACQANAGGLITYRWTAPATGTFTFDTAGSDFDTVLSIYTTLGCEEVTCNDDGEDATNRESALTLMTEEGETYRIVLQGFNGATGRYVLNIEEAD